jgi:nitrogen fixation protein NifB
VPLPVLRGHPCFDEQAHDRVGRVHLPVAPRCNIQCAFCERRICAHLTMQHPGWAERLLAPQEAAELVRRLVIAHPGEKFVVGVAGPGEPLENLETFEALALVQQEHPSLVRCISTNGLLLAEKLPQLLEVGVSALTVTVNAPDAEVGERIYAWVQYGGRAWRGAEGARILVEQQFRGIEAALRSGLAVKVNTVLIPGVNDQHVARLAFRLRELGVGLMNIMPLIPSGQMRGIPAPTCEELQRARQACEAVIPQFRRCEHCRADVVRFPHSAASC